MNIALLLAGGSGTRFGADIPKQFIKVNGMEVILYTLLNLEKAAFIDNIVAVVPTDWQEHVRKLVTENGIDKCSMIVPGGKTRAFSIQCGINAMRENADGDDIVCLIDANRPMLPHDVIENSIDLAKEYGASLTVYPITDALVVSEDKCLVSHTEDRYIHFMGQTPEAVRFEIADAAVNGCISEGKTEGTLQDMLIDKGYRQALNPGSVRDFKITTKEDIDLFKAFLAIDSVGY